MDASMLFGGTKTIYMDRMNTTLTDVCIKDAEITSKDDISPKCDQADEYIVPCDGKDVSGYSCTLNEETNQYKITGLKHSGVIQTDAVVEDTIVNNNGGSSGSISVCLMNYSCSSWSSCGLSGNQTRICTKVAPLYCYGGLKPKEVQTCTYVERDERILTTDIGLVSAASDNESNNQEETSPWILIGAGVITYIVIYFIFSLISRNEAKKFNPKKLPIAKVKK
jgi:hypothetical protein